jgi:hypothetical protein
VATTGVVARIFQEGEPGIDAQSDFGPSAEKKGQPLQLAQGVEVDEVAKLADLAHLIPALP